MLINKLKPGETPEESMARNGKPAPIGLLTLRAHERLDTRATGLGRRRRSADGDRGNTPPARERQRAKPVQPATRTPAVTGVRSASCSRP